MPSVEELLVDLDGNGFEQRDVLFLLTKLTRFANMSAELKGVLAPVFTELEMAGIFGSLTPPGKERLVMSKLLGEIFTEKQAQIYMMSIVERKSHADIAKELGKTKGCIQGQLDRAKAKVVSLQLEKLHPISPSEWKVIIKNSPLLTEQQVDYCIQHFVKGKTQYVMAKEMQKTFASVSFCIAKAKCNFNLDSLL